MYTRSTPEAEREGEGSLSLSATAAAATVAPQPPAAAACTRAAPKWRPTTIVNDESPLVFLGAGVGAEGEEVRGGGDCAAPSGRRRRVKQARTRGKLG